MLQVLRQFLTKMSEGTYIDTAAPQYPPSPLWNLQVVLETTGKHWGFRWNARDITTARLIEIDSQSEVICPPTFIISLPLHGSQFNDCPPTIALPESIGYKGSIWFEGLDLDSPC